MLIEIDYFRFALLQKHSKAKLKVRDKWLYWEYFANIEICPQNVFVFFNFSKVKPIKKGYLFCFFFHYRSGGIYCQSFFARICSIICERFLWYSVMEHLAQGFETELKLPPRSDCNL